MVEAFHRRCRCTRVVVILGVLSLGAARAEAFQKTDVITLDNGDTITCEIKQMQRGRLRCSTDAMGTVYIKWEHIAQIATDKTLEVELSSGQRYFGSLQPGDDPEELVIAVGAATTTIPQEEVAFVQPIRPTFWGRLDGSIDFGLSFTQAETQTDYSLGAETKYTGRANVITAEVSSMLKIRGEDTTTNRQTLTFGWQRQLRWERWFGIAIGNFEHNDELNIDLRATGGYGVGRFLAQTNRWTWMAFAAGLYTREQFKGEQEGVNSLEAGFGTSVQVFTFGDHETDISTNLIVSPNLTTSGRYRVSFTSKIKREFIKDFYFSIDLFETYDSDPPQQGAKKNDFGITTALGWSF